MLTVGSEAAVQLGEIVDILGERLFVDIDERTFNMDPAKLREAVERVAAGGKRQPKATIAVDLSGQLHDYGAFEAVAQEYDPKVLEDAAQFFGAMHHNRRAGGFSHAAATSFFSAKPLGVYSDGGAVHTDTDELATICDSPGVHGKGSEKYDNTRIGVNARLNTGRRRFCCPSCGRCRGNWRSGRRWRSATVRVSSEM